MEKYFIFEGWVQNCVCVAREETLIYFGPRPISNGKPFYKRLPFEIFRVQNKITKTLCGR